MRRRAHLAVAIAAAMLAVTLGVYAQGPAAGRGQGPGRGRGAVVLPAGTAQPFIQATCQGCHNLNMITGAAGYDQAGWRSLIGTMIRLPDDQMAEVTGYLAENFPEQPGRRPTLVPGPVHIEFKEWIVPTLGQRPRDPLQMPDGTIWWAGMYGSLIGRLNPTTGEMREFLLDTTARPHSITAAPDGAIWYTGNGNATIGRLDPATGDIKVYPMPDPAATDPHTLVFDQNGTLWFTVQGGNRIGRMNTATGDIQLVEPPTPNARPYGIVINSKGEPWVAYNGANKIARVDPETMAISEFVVAPEPTTVRRLALLSDDTVFYVDSGRGYLGRFDPRTETYTEWPSPSGRLSHPYAIAVVDDIVWYNESNQRPDALVRFDPKTEQFQSWAIPSGVGIIRNMRVTPDGNLVIHQSSSNRVGLVLIP